MESIPNDVIDSSTATCTRDPADVATLGSRNTEIDLTTIAATGSTPQAFVKFILNFNGNPGGHKTPQVVVVDAAGGYTIQDGAGNDGLDTIAVYDTGITGEFFDFFGQKCGVTVTIQTPLEFYTAVHAAGVDSIPNAAGEIHYGEVQRASVASGTALDRRKLMECLGDSNAVSGDNEGVENWDTGSIMGDFGVTDTVNSPTRREAVPGRYPHIVKLVEKNAPSEYDGGVYTIMNWHVDDENFVLSAAVEALDANNEPKEYEVCGEVLEASLHGTALFQRQLDT